MAVLNISLPDSMRDYIERRLEEGQFSSTSEYIRDLVRGDQRRRDEERLEALLLEGLESGDPIEVDEAYIARKRAQLATKIGRIGKDGE